MKTYSIINLKLDGGLIDFIDTKSRLSSFFIWNEGDGKFLNFSKPRGIAQKSLHFDKLKNSDYLPANLGIPILSKKSKEIFEKKIPSEMSFHECVIECNGSEETFFLCKIKKYLSIIDEDKSSFRTLLDGSQLLDIAAYKYDESFFIARDKIFCEKLIVSQKFVDICNEEKIYIDFIDTAI